MSVLQLLPLAVLLPPLIPLVQLQQPCGKVHLTHHAIALDRRSPLNHMLNWDFFNVKLIDEFGSINIFGRDVDQLFDLFPCYESIQEVAKDHSPKIQDTSNQPGGHAGIPQTGKPPVLLSLSHWSRTSQEASLWKWGRHFTTKSPYSKNSQLHL